MVDLLGDYTIRMVTIGSAIVGGLCGALGSFAYVRRQSLVGDVVGHAALPGVALAYLISQSKDLAVLMLGAGLTGLLALAVSILAVRYCKMDQGTAFASVLSTSFGVGVLLLSLIQQTHAADQAGLDRFLFGQAATLVEPQIITMAGVGTGALALMLIFFRPLVTLSFDPSYSRSTGLPVVGLESILLVALVSSVVVGISVAGVVLVAALLAAPAAAAHRWCTRFSTLVAVSAAFGALSGATGGFLSSTWANVPTGPLIILILTGLVIVSLLWGRRRTEPREVPS
ncbi:MAG: metal ABC transporter permease [Fimbriimonadaceae bacterium]|jgi:manganese/zinc/iron transport system permease protein|nr:metal ABC transporter permease [Fimbriimonadaceae bacterium]